MSHNTQFLKFVKAEKIVSKSHTMTKNKVRILFTFIPSPSLLTVPLGSGWLCDFFFFKKASHIALAVMASNTVASKSMEPVLDFAVVSTLSL